MRLILTLIVLILGQGYKLNYKEIEQIKQNGLLTIRGSSASEGYQSKEKCCFSIVMENKNKRKGYDKIRKKYNTIKKILLAKDVISDKISFQLVKQETRMNYKKKIWFFKRIVCVLTQDNQQSNIKRILKKHSIDKINFGSSLNSQQDLLMKALNDANRKAKTGLDRIDYKILNIKSISVINKEIQTWYLHADDSSDEYDPDVSTLSQQIKKSASAQQSYQSEDQQNQKVQVQIVFSVVYDGDDYQDEDESTSDEEAQSQKHNKQSSQDRREKDSSQQQL